VSLLRSDSGRKAGIGHFRRAIAADPAYAPAYAGLVRMYLGSHNARASGSDEWFRLASEAAAKAVELDSSLAEAHVAMGWVNIASWNLAAAETALRHAVALDPSAPRGHEGLARAYMWQERHREQLAAAETGFELDPFSHSAIRELALALYVNGRCDEALELLRPLRSLTPTPGVAGVVAGQCHAANQRWSAATEEFRWSMDNSGATMAPAMLGYALARAGRPEEARAILARLLSGELRSHGAFGVAIVYAGLGESDRAFAWLYRAVDENSLTVYIMGPMFAELHRDPRFSRVRERIRR
jgi:tetratricopeptide (TPR) repeat protein